MKSQKTTRRLTKFVSLTLSLMFFLAAASSWGRCAPTTVEESFEGNDAVFSGTVSQVDVQNKNSDLSEETDVSNGDDMLTVHFKLNKSWKGVDGNDTIAISTPSRSYWFVCAFMNFSVGDNYVIFASRLHDTEESGDSERLYTDYCEGNKELEDSSSTQALFEQLDNLKSEMQVESEEADDLESANQKV